MFSQNVVVHYQDGNTAEVNLTQWSIGQFSMYAAAKGWKIDPQAPGLMALPMVRYQAYAEIHRTSATKPSFDKWDISVTEVETTADESAVDPTEPAASDG
jgi:hypothetical protein